MGTLVSNSSDNENTRRRTRKQIHFSYMYKFDGKGIFREVYKILFDIGEKRLTNILKHMKAYGAVPRTYGNKEKKPQNALSFQDIKKVVQFIINFAEENGIPLPAAPRGRQTRHPLTPPPLFSSTPLSQRKTFINCMSAVMR